LCITIFHALICSLRRLCHFLSALLCEQLHRALFQEHVIYSELAQVYRLGASFPPVNILLVRDYLYVTLVTRSFASSESVPLLLDALQATSTARTTPILRKLVCTLRKQNLSELTETLVELLRRSSDVRETSTDATSTTQYEFVARLFSTSLDNHTFATVLRLTSLKYDWRALKLNKVILAIVHLNRKHYDDIFLFLSLLPCRPLPTFTRPITPNDRIYREYIEWSKKESKSEAKLWQSQEIGTVIGQIFMHESDLTLLAKFVFDLTTRVWMADNFLRGLYFSAGVLASAIPQLRSSQNVRKKLKGLAAKEIGALVACYVDLLRQYFATHPHIIENFSQEDWIGFHAVFIAEIAVQRNLVFEDQHLINTLILEIGNKWTAEDTQTLSSLIEAKFSFRIWLSELWQEIKNRFNRK
jgi:hypothetical protein